MPCLITWLIQQSKHILFVSLYAGLVERIDSEHISAYAASFFEEVQQLPERQLIETGKSDFYIRYSSVYVCYHCTELCHLVDVIYSLVGNKVQSVQIIDIINMS